MQSQIVFGLAVLAIAASHPVEHANSYVMVHHDESPVYKHATYSVSNEDDGLKHDHHEEYVHYPKYEYKYGVQDHHTGDSKSLKESRDGDAVKGEYSVVQPDGRIRTVKYSADDHNGFNAEVVYSGHALHFEVQKVENSQVYYH